MEITWGMCYLCKFLEAQNQREGPRNVHAELVLQVILTPVKRLRTTALEPGSPKLAAHYQGGMNTYSCSAGRKY